METQGVIASSVKLIFKAEITIERRATPDYRIGNVIVPSEVFLPMEHCSTMELRSPWRLDPGERNINGLQGFQRRISSADTKEVRYFFIPARYLVRILEN